MPLTAHEQRVLDRLELDLSGDLPSAPVRVPDDRLTEGRPRLLRYGLLFIAGLALLIAGVVVKQTVVGVFAFVVMCGAVAAAERAAATRARTLRRRLPQHLRLLLRRLEESLHHPS